MNVFNMEATDCKTLSHCGNGVTSNKSEDKYDDDYDRKLGNSRVRYKRPNKLLTLWGKSIAHDPSDSIATQRPEMNVCLPVPSASIQCTDHIATMKNSSICSSELMQNSGRLCFQNHQVKFQCTDLKYIGELGNGSSGQVAKYIYPPANLSMAVKTMRRRSGVDDDDRRILMDLDVILRSKSCQYIVDCIGYIFCSTEVWICMELMDTCFGKILLKNKSPIPDYVLGRATFSVVSALIYLKDVLSILHRDIKPSNILINQKGDIKLCDFGLSVGLCDSQIKSSDFGCVGYLAPERIDPSQSVTVDGVSADVWSLGITLMELTTGLHPYNSCGSDFEVMIRILTEDPPHLVLSDSDAQICSLVNACVEKNARNRPDYAQIMAHPFVKFHEERSVDIMHWLKVILNGMPI